MCAKELQLSRQDGIEDGVLLFQGPPDNLSIIAIMNSLPSHSHFSAARTLVAKHVNAGRLLLGLGASILVGCASPQSSGTNFLSSYSGMEQESKMNDKVVYRGDLAKLTNYRQFFLEDVRVFQPKDMEEKKITQADLDTLQKSLREALEAEVKASRYSLASQPGPDTLSLRAGIVDIKPGNPAVFAATYAPYVGAATTAAGLVTGNNLGAGSATVEFEILDSVTRAQFLAGIDREAGSKLEVVSGMTRMGHIEAAFKDWAKQLGERLRDPTHE